MKLKLKSSVQLKRIAANNKPSWDKYYGVEEDPTTGLFIVRSVDSTKYGLVDKDGVEIVKPIYDEILNFSEGMARIMKRGQNNYGFSYGFINVKGEVVIELKFPYAWSFFKGMAKVSMRGAGDYSKKQGFIDKTGNYIVEPFYQTLTRTRQGFKGRRSGVWIKMDKNGKENLPSIIQNKDFEMITESVYVIDNGITDSASLVDIKENVVLTKGFKRADVLKDQKGIKNPNIIKIEKNNLFGVFDVEQKKLIVPIKYESIAKINDIFYLCKLDRRWVIFNSKEKKETDNFFSAIQYSGLNNILESPVGWSTVDEKRNLKFYDPNFKPTKSWDKNYDEVKFISYLYFYDERRIHNWWISPGLKYFYVKKDDKGGLYVTDMNDRGKQITPLIFDFDKSIKGTENRALSHIRRILLKGFDEKDYWYDPREHTYYTTETGSIRIVLSEKHYFNDLDIVKMFGRYGLKDTKTNKIVLPAVYNKILISSRENKLYELYTNGEVDKKDGLRSILNKEEIYEKGNLVKDSLRTSPSSFLHLFTPEVGFSEPLTEKEMKSINHWFKINTVEI